MTELVFCKLGGSIITDKQRSSTPRVEEIERLAGETRAAIKVHPELRLLLGHGSGSYGHVAALKYHVQQGIADDEDWWGYAETGAAAARLNRIVTDTFIRAGVPVVSIQPSATARARGGEIEALEDYGIREALRHRLVPLIHGDVAFDADQGCTILSTESEFAYLATRLRPARIVLVGEVDGVFDRDPLPRDARGVPMPDPSARQISHITPDSFAGLRARLGSSHGIDVTGGMLSKVEAMVHLVASGAIDRVHIISGHRHGALTQALLDPAVAGGTLIVGSSRHPGCFDVND